MHACELITEKNVKDIIDSVDTILSDCDGVLWNDNDTISGAPEAVQLLLNMGKRVFYVTNNSIKNRAEYKVKCNQMGLPAEEENVIGSSYVTAKYITDVLKYNGKVYMIGSSGLKAELENVGLSTIGIGPDEQTFETFKERSEIEIDPDIKCVVMGFDKYFCYAKMLKATAYLSQPGCHFVGTNTDAYLPMGSGRNLPGTGSMITAVEVAAQRKPIMCGKPAQPMFDCLVKEQNVDPAKTIMIGDRLDTDIAFGGNCGFRSLLVLTGASTVEEARRYQSSNSLEDQKLVPDYYIQSMDELRKLIKKVYSL